ncbi:hypothetical protein AVEN_57803-1 [Araneus ventricosus]|uniref:Uncharacterized protein n=1 Tax=Araneus ventricosus TaxID=182803 RepID=A0A4Y2RAT1_ARAVE|nr:hypothetical protein AVEN_57803-1 [Araneus ventricosus]
MGRLRKLLAEVETGEESNFDNEDNGPEDVLEEILLDHESFSEHDSESEEDEVDSVNEDVHNLECFSSKDGGQWRKTKFRENIRCLNIVSRLP